ncbi:5-fold beta-flower protein [Pedobacter immunditicola]|uniref:5-fold beta-flower protein n=1 Tax=Pedobacter immunditicola TaxID=3133440 RepID=UPI0030AD9FE2
MRKKHLLFSLLSVLIIFTVNVYSQTKPDTIKSTPIFINKKGEIHDHGWNKLGFITKDNIVKNNKGKTIYFIDGKGNVIDADGKNLGKARKNGNYYNIKGENVITVKDINAEKCEILDPKGHFLGTVHKNYKLHACAAHCYFLTQQKKE